MLELRPTCENCNKSLPPASTEAMICSYECTFCTSCVHEVLENVCPNCGGGFCQRPIRPSRNLKNDNYLGKDPASTVIRHRPLDLTAHQEFVEKIGGMRSRHSTLAQDKNVLGTRAVKRTGTGEMPKLIPIDAENFSLVIAPDLSVSAQERKPGPSQRMHGMTLGIVTMEHDAPHDGELHPDGDEILYVISGRVRVIGESAKENPLELGPGAACIVKTGEWHKVRILEKTQLLHVTPGPNGDHRPL